MKPLFMTFALTLTLPWAATRAQTPIELCYPMESNARVPCAGSANLLRTQSVWFDHARLCTAAVGDVFAFPGFDGDRFAVRLTTREPIAAVPGAFHWHAELVGDPQGEALFTVVGDAMTAYLVPGDHRPTTLTLSSIRCEGWLQEKGRAGKTCGTCGGRHDDADHAPHTAVPTPPLRQSAGVDIGGCHDDPSTIQVLMVYDDLALVQAGLNNTQLMESLCLNSLAQCSGAMGGTGIDLTFAATSVRPLNLILGGDMPTTLDQVTDFDGVADELHTWRRDEVADLVAVVVGDIAAHGNTAGIGWLPNTAYEFSLPSKGFTVSEGSTVNDLTLAHEIGHNLGCAHDDANAATTPFYSYAYGWVTTYFSNFFDQRTVQTIMAYYPPCNSVVCTYQRPHKYSNPLYTVTYGSYTVALGDANHDNRQSIIHNAQSIADWGLRLTPLYGTPQITQQPTTRAVSLGSQADPVMLSVRTADPANFAWESWNPGASQWQAVPGQDGPDLLLPFVTANDLRTYRCAVSSCNTLLWSNSAQLTLDPSSPTLHQTNAAGPGYGKMLESAGDFDGDGYEDFAYCDNGALNATGQVWVVSGATELLLATLTGQNPGAYFGSGLAAIDVDGDRKSELLVGAGGAPNGGQIVRYWLDQFGGLQQQLVVTGAQLGLAYIGGGRLATGQYVDGDGHPDVVFTSNTHVVAASFEPTGLRELWRQPLFHQSVQELEVIGDMNRDGYDDVAVGMPFWSADRGALQLLSGRDGSELARIEGDPGVGPQYVGRSVTAFGNPNGLLGAAPGIAYGVPGWSNGTGKVVVCRLDLVPIWTATGAVAGQRYGWSLSSVLTAESRQSLLIGSQPTSPAIPNVLERRNGLGLNLLHSRTGGTPTYGARVASIDVNGDGVAEDLIAEPETGTVYVHRGALATGTPAVWARGPICPGSTGDLLRVYTLRSSRINDTVRYFITSVQGPAFAVSLLGLAPASVPLDPVGATGCTLSVSLDVMKLWTVYNPVAATIPASEPIPNAPSLVGLDLHVQAAATDATANPFGWVTSNAMVFRIGAL